MKINYQLLEKKINIKFKNRDLLCQSLTHKSFDSKTNNEKLEFLGDRVLGLVIAKKLLEIYPNEKEGILDKKFASLVNKKTCLEIANKIELQKYILSYNVKKNTIFNSRINTMRPAKIITKPVDSENDFITSRIMWLDGLEYGKNKGEGIDSFSRYIYIHGTHEEGLIGKKASHGCIRMFNNDVIELFDEVQEGTYVLIKA